MGKKGGLDKVEMSDEINKMLGFGVENYVSFAKMSDRDIFNLYRNLSTPALAVNVIKSLISYAAPPEVAAKVKAFLIATNFIAKRVQGGEKITIGSVVGGVKSLFKKSEGKAEDSPATSLDTDDLLALGAAQADTTEKDDRS